MNAILAKNVRKLRDSKHWTQQHLADTAGILLRTVQRVEKGDGASVETLGALSNAFDVSIDGLQTDVDAVLVPRHRGDDRLRQQPWDFLGRHAQFDAAGLARRSADEAAAFELDHPSMNGWRRDAEEALEVRLCRRPAVDHAVAIDEREVLALQLGELRGGNDRHLSAGMINGP